MKIQNKLKMKSYLNMKIFSAKWVINMHHKPIKKMNNNQQGN